MLSLFPQILFLAPFSALLIRIAVAVILALGAWRHFAHPRIQWRAWSVLEAAASLAFIVGAWTQPVAILVALGILIGFFFPEHRVFPRSTMILVIIMCLSLLVTGPGAFAFDLPL